MHDGLLASSRQQAHKNAPVPARALPPGALTVRKGGTMTVTYLDDPRAPEAVRGFVPSSDDVVDLERRVGNVTHAVEMFISRLRWLNEEIAKTRGEVDQDVTVVPTDEDIGRLWRTLTGLESDAVLIREHTQEGLAFLDNFRLDRGEVEFQARLRAGKIDD
jgi:hypothetical protein